jgi:transcriptional regulator with XRE-family HTH domain
VGIEIQLAAGAGVPVLLLGKQGIKLSKMVTGGLGHSREIEFADLAELDTKLHKVLGEIRPQLERRRKSANQIDGDVFPERLGDLRARSNYSVDFLSSTTGLLDARIEDLQQRNEHVSQPMLSEVRSLAHAFGVPTSYLLGETPPVSDSVALASIENLKRYSLEKDLRFTVYSELRDEYLASRKEIGFAAKMRDSAALSEEDWRNRHERFLQRGKDLALKLFE